MSDFVKDYIQQSVSVKTKILSDSKTLTAIQSLGEKASDSLRSGGKILMCGNGGSFADCQHIVAEFVSKLQKDRQPLPAICLGSNFSNLTAISNDYGYEFVFSRELKSLYGPNDLLIGLSTSGMSPNILRVLEDGVELGLDVFALLGKDGGDAKNICESIIVPSSYTATIQECHIMIGHLLVSIAEREWLP